MEFNLAISRKIRSDVGPYKVLTEADLAKLRDGLTASNGIAITAQTMAVLCELGARYRLKELVYHRSPATTENIAIFAKQGNGNDYPWIQLNYVSTPTKLTVDLAADQNHYEVFRIVHTVTGGTAQAYELEIISNSEGLGFGPTGQVESFSVETGTNTLTPESVPIFNKETAQQKFYCLLEGEDSDSSSLTIGPTFSGVFVGHRESGLGLPKDFPWSSGAFFNTRQVGNTVVLSGTLISGTYYTPVIDISGLDGQRFFWTETISGSNEIDDFSSLNSVPTVGVRFSNITPTASSGWISGQLADDPNWNVFNGTIPFVQYDNNHILNPQYNDYFQARVEFHATVSGQTPILQKIGIEEALSVTIPPLTYDSVYVKSSLSDHTPGRKTALIVWFFEARNEEQ